MAIIKVLDNGPLLVYLCRCGLADKMPYCDGSHGDKFDSKVRV